MTKETDIQIALRAEDFEDAQINKVLLDEGKKFSCYEEKRVVLKADPRRCLAEIKTEGWHQQKINRTTILLRSDTAYAVLTINGKINYANCYIRIWAVSPEAIATSLNYYFDQVKQYKLDEILFDLEWRFTTSQGLRGAQTVEQPTQVLDEAYPCLPQGVNKFISDYLDADETVLVLQGPPGMGKTRLVRAILREMTIRKGDRASAIYSGDKSVWESDEVFIHFISSSFDVLLIEDADHLITPRSDGNQHLHRFLNISDGIAQAQGRKIIFSTNLPSIHNLDDALVRPGRCFAHIFTRPLELAEAKKLLFKIGGNHAAVLELNNRSSNITVAEVYQIHKRHGGVIGKDVQTVRGIRTRKQESQHGVYGDDD